MAEKRFEVTIVVRELNHRQVVIVTAPDEWVARTRAMFACTAPLRGQAVDYHVKPQRS